VRQVVDTPGKVKRLSLAVVVDGIYQGKKHTFSARSPEDMRQYANLTKKAVGFNTARGDQLEISCAPLAVQAEEGIAAFKSEDGWSSGLGFSWKIGLLVLLTLGVLMFLMKRRKAPARPNLLEGPRPQALPASGVHDAVLPEATSPLALQAQNPPPALPESVDGKDKVTQLIATHPDRAVEVLRLWLHEKGGK